MNVENFGVIESHHSQGRCQEKLNIWIVILPSFEKISITHFNRALKAIKVNSTASPQLL